MFVTQGDSADPLGIRFGTAVASEIVLFTTGTHTFVTVIGTFVGVDEKAPADFAANGFCSRLGACDAGEKHTGRKSSGTCDGCATTEQLTAIIVNLVF